jgi:Rieske Fe-S protein
METSAGRRAALRNVIWAAIGLGFAPCLRADQESAAESRPREGDLLVKADDPGQMPLGPDDIPVNAAQTLAWAMDPNDRTVRSGSRLNRIVLVRFDSQELGEETRARAGDGVVAYTAICTHTGCDVTDWLAEERLLYCPCHYSRFDPKNAARVVDGPAPRPLPALPLKVEDGRLVVARPFTARVGFEVG